MSSYINKEEGRLKSLFARELKRQAPSFLVLGYSTNGAPDRSIVGNGRQTNWEFKNGTPDFRSPGDQELCCTRLAEQGHCRYVVWVYDGSDERTMILHPRDVLGKKGKWRDIVLRPEAWCSGFDMKWLVAQVLKAHEVTE